MVEEAKSCFKNPSQSIKNEEIVLKGKGFFDCIENGDVSSNSIFIVQDCWNSLSLEQKASLIAQGGAATESVCREVFAGNEYVEEICSYVYMIVHVFEK